MRVEGTLNAEWADRLSGLAITTSSPSADSSSSGQGKTVLVGRLRDQAALSDVLTTLYELHLPVSSVECLESG